MNENKKKKNVTLWVKLRLESSLNQFIHKSSRLEAILSNWGYQNQCHFKKQFRYFFLDTIEIQ